MRLMPLFHLSYADVKAARVALAAGAVAGLIVIAACTDSGGKSITAPRTPAGPRNATINSSIISNAKFVTLCVDNTTSPAGNYKFVNSHENDQISLTGYGFHYVDATHDFWYGAGDGGDPASHTTFIDDGSATPGHVAPGAQYTVAAGAGNCVQVLYRDVADPKFLTVPKQQENDGWSAVTMTWVGSDVAGGVVYDHVDCLQDQGAESGTIYAAQPDPCTATTAAPDTYGNTGNPTRALANFEHGTVITFFFKRAPVLASCTLGYPDTSHNPQSSAVFNESEVLTGFALEGSKLHAWYTDEHALTLGVDSVFIKAAKGGGPNQGFSYSIAAGISNGTNSMGAAGSPFLDIGKLITDIPIAASPLDGAGRPLYPGVYLTDLTALGASSRAGDWQQGGTPRIPTGVYGTWKGALITIDNTHSPAQITLKPDADPAKNHRVVGTGGLAPPIAAQDFGYSSDIQWTLASLNLVAGHDYRAQVIVHDGDQNKTGGDVGQKCIHIIQSTP